MRRASGREREREVAREKREMSGSTKTREAKICKAVVKRKKRRNHPLDFLERL
jgi:hypothetical protein